MAKMTVNRKAQRILELAMKINNTPTRRKTTGDKPTVFVCFSGHINVLEVEVYMNGWEENVRSDCNYRFRLSNASSTDERMCKMLNKRMDDCIALLKDIWQKCKPTNVDKQE
ncbi:MAG: hypothetical protein UD936_08050 [Acutalibacteraceae bacterium]|nr:hypothetical protein [Acutalibacteraceae bacterium]